MIEKPTTASRKGARRMSEIPNSVRVALEAGTLETANLVEWLVIDVRRLVPVVAADLRLGSRAVEQLSAAAAQAAALGVVQRNERLGAAFLASLGKPGLEHGAYGRLASHRSDMARTWAAYAVMSHPDLSLAERLARVRPFAADHHMSVREAAWMVFRPSLAEDLDRGLKLLTKLARDPNPNIRRFASEVSRPRGVWCSHLKALREDPAPGAPILEALRSDASRYVQTSVANWLNDASKDAPSFVRGVLKCWLRDSPTPETLWIANHATRTLRRLTEKTPPGRRRGPQRSG